MLLKLPISRSFNNPLCQKLFKFFTYLVRQIGRVAEFRLVHLVLLDQLDLVLLVGQLDQVVLVVLLLLEVRQHLEHQQLRLVLGHPLGQLDLVGLVVLVGMVCMVVELLVHMDGLVDDLGYLEDLERLAFLVCQVCPEVPLVLEVQVSNNRHIVQSLPDVQSCCFGWEAVLICQFQ